MLQKVNLCVALLCTPAILKGKIKNESQGADKKVFRDRLVFMDDTDSNIETLFGSNMR